MKILVLEFSSDRRSVAVADTAAQQLLSEAHERGGRESAPFRLISSALEQAAARQEEVEGLLVGTGPGSFAGIRTAIAVAQGMSLGRNLRVAAASSAAALAREALKIRPGAGTWVVVDAQRKEFYLGYYASEGNRVRLREPLRIVPSAAVAAMVEQGEWVAGAGVTGIPQVLDVEPTASSLAPEAWPAWPEARAEDLEPVHLRTNEFRKIADARP